MKRLNWNSIEMPLFPWVRTVERIIRAQRPPDLRGPIINIFSDYSGDNKQSPYEVISILYFDLAASMEWEYRRREIRRRYLKDGRRMSFKSLGDRQRQRALIPFLQAANDIHGMCVSVAIKKSIKVLCSDEALFTALIDRLQFETKWKYRAFERMLRVSHLISVLIAGLSNPGQHIYWMSDEDALHANMHRSKDLGYMLSLYTSFYVKHQLGELGLGTTALDEGDRYEEDAAAIADLAAGAVAEILQRVSAAAGGKVRPRIAIPFDDEFSPKTEVLCSWLSDESQKLRRATIVFEQEEKGTYSVSRFDIEIGRAHV